MLLSLALALFSSAISAAPLEPRANLPLPSRAVYQFSNPNWIENIAVRSNGDLLLTMLTTPELYQLREAQGPSPQLELVHSFDSLTGLMGIAETTQDTFIVAGGNFSSPGVGVPGTFSVWEIKVCGRRPEVSKVVDIPEAVFLNGVVANSLIMDEVLIADSSLGKVFKVNVKEKKYQVAIELPEMAPPANAAIQLGINGVHIQNGFLYWTNTLLDTLFRVQINKNGIVAVGAKVETVATTTSSLDDFALDRKGTSWVTTNGNNSVLAISPNGKSVVVAGSISELTVAGATAAAFGRTPKDRDILYVVTSGALAAPVNGTITEGGKIVAINTKDFA
ncbi:hypothetical protein NW754_002213 [Fusarium falciforme]|uniref:SMP-30/Gluconolactonase/LRE-like region domain-containing protein n=1 Tax=Fusarium falciforme TaxID=195108 RepID=A0A9W8URL3_9HYPO|nr:hypothetical protein NW754_002213 [Fusarium falciforme]KAJ4175794.1 hypothetical protein NW755_014753 [Fusarium falciforme]KAJ4177049.1 hypothetical protein NW767_015246 [Fusarium falciforme]KAJ4179974.1 hypothetical protein NW759_017263 [Fusarium solani]KAJ4217675.1 hypothetical protein NW757_014627 [Fusarium falciforme]